MDTDYMGSIQIAKIHQAVHSMISALFCICIYFITKSSKEGKFFQRHIHCFKVVFSSLTNVTIKRNNTLKKKTTQITTTKTCFPKVADKMILGCLQMWKKIAWNDIKLLQRENDPVLILMVAWKKLRSLMPLCHKIISKPCLEQLSTGLRVWNLVAYYYCIYF